jgi:CRISPR-associated endonuclease Csn1
MVLSEYPDHQRNKRGDYSQSLPRELLAEELALLFTRQRELGNPFAGEPLQQAILAPETGLFWQQKPALSGAAMLNLIGKCTFEPLEYRAAKHSWSAERFVWLTRLNNLRVSVDGESGPLCPAAREAALPLPYEKAKVSYKQLKTHLVKLGLLPESARFAGLNYRDGGKDPEDAKLIELKGWHELRKTLESAGLSTEWHGLATQADKLDAITTILSVYKTDAEIREQLGQLGLPGAVMEALLGVSFSDFIRLSLKALAGILPHMQVGKRYDEACLLAGYHHSQLTENSASRYLPALDDNAPNNPVVKRALNQARKVVNAIIREYGPPRRVHIEMARDLSRPLDERQKIEKEQKAFGERNEQLRSEFAEEFGRRPTGREFEKWLLYREQDGKCAYSLDPINLNQLIDDTTYSEIDHALPYSRSFDDTRNNKVLVLTRENRDKGNRTPYEYLDGASDSPQWQAFEAFVRSNHKYRQAKRDRLLRKHFGKDEAAGFKERNLTDTRYACRYFKNFVERHLALHPESGAQRCVVVSGQLTSFLRARWGLAKLREGSDRHHAIDAAVVAACSHGMVKRLSDYARRKELDKVRSGFVDPDSGEIFDHARLQQLEQHFPRPWPHFDVELCLRSGLDRSTGAVSSDLSAEQVQQHLTALGYDDSTLAASKPLFVSRAPKRLGSGAAHQETIRSIGKSGSLLKDNKSAVKTPLEKLSLDKLEQIVGFGRDTALIDAIRERLLQHGGDGKKAFAANQPPLRKPSKSEEKSPIIRAVKLLSTQKSGIPIRKGIADNDKMLRVDVFSKAGKFHLVPVYVHHRVAKTLPDRAIVAFKDEDEWTLIDESFEFRFSLYPNDLVKIVQKNAVPIWAYYRSCHSGTGAINAVLHDRNFFGEKTTSKQLHEKGKIPGNDKIGLIEGIGVKTALSLEKFHVDVLGRIYPAKPEPRRGLA